MNKKIRLVIIILIIALLFDQTYDCASSPKLVKAISIDEFHDDFNSIANWTIHQGSWVVENGSLANKGTGNSRWIFLNSYSAIDFQAKLTLSFIGTSGTQWAGLMIRSLDNSSFTWIFLYRDYPNNFSRIYTRSLRNNTIVQNVASANFGQNLNPSTWYSLSVNVSRNHLIATVPEISGASLDTQLSSLMYDGLGLMTSGGDFYFDSLSIKCVAISDNQNLSEKSANFLINSAAITDLNNINYGGIRGMRLSNGSWFAPNGYTETTGYEIQSLVNLYEVTGNSDYLKAAIAASDWETSVVQYTDFNSEGLGGIRNTDPNASELHSWHTAATMAGLATIYQLTNNQTYLERTIIGMNFIVKANSNQQNISDGGLVGKYSISDQTFTSDYLASSAGAQANFVLSVFDILHNDTYLSLAKKSLDILAISQLSNGTWWRFIYNNGAALPVSYNGQQIENYAHYVMYITQSLIHGYMSAGNKNYLEAAERAWNYVAGSLRNSNGLIGARRTEVAQFGLTSKMLYDATGNLTYLSYANEQKEALFSVQADDGGFLNSDLSEESWACKFAIDFDLNMRNLSKIETPHLIYFTSRLLKIQQYFENGSLLISCSAPIANFKVLSFTINTMIYGKPLSVDLNGISVSQDINWTFDTFSNLLTINIIKNSDPIETSVNWVQKNNIQQSSPTPVQPSVPPVTIQPSCSPTPVQPSVPPVTIQPSCSPTPVQPSVTKQIDIPQTSIDLSILTYLIIIILAVYLLVPAFGILVFRINKKDDNEVNHVKSTT
jgi:hypothetical protein